MESSSVYMCFPCYQEFNTLEEVLEHQLTCTAEDEQLEQPGTPVTVPMLQTRVNTGAINNFPFSSCDCMIMSSAENKTKKHQYFGDVA